MASPRGRWPGAAPQGTDLVAEIHSEHDEAVQARIRQQKARRTKRIIWAVTMVIVFAVAGVAGKLGWDAQRHARAMENARTHIVAGTPGDLTAAVAEIDKGLGIKPGDTEALALLALLRAHEAIVTGQLEPLTASLESLQGADEPEAKLARAIDATLQGDLATANEIVDGLDDALEGLENRRARAWLVATFALADPYNEGKVAAGIEALEAVVADDEPWPPSHRWLAALLARAGRVDDALARLATAREVAPADLGIAADEALLHAIVASHDQGVLEVGETIVEAGALSPRSRARAQLAVAMVRARLGKDDADKARDEAWAESPEWDVDTKDLVVMAAFIAHDAKTGRKWLDSLGPAEDVDATFAAWEDLLEGNETKALERCAELPQSRPKVALIQALALAEQQRWAEAGPWIDRAIAGLGDLVELRVAKQRVAAHTDDPKAAIEALEDLADDYPHAGRVYTALGEAYLLSWKDRDKDDPPKEAEKALKKALEEEHRPAEAAYLLGTIEAHEAIEKPKHAEDALEMYAKALELRPEDLRYRIAYGEYLATHGDPKLAREVLGKLLDEDAPVGDPLVTYARLEIAHARSTGKKVAAADFDAWIAKATQGGAAPDGIIRARAALALANDPGPIPQTIVAELSGLLTQNPKDIETRVLHSEALIRIKDFSTARASLKYGIKKTLKALDGRLYLAQAAVEAADKGERLAARLAYQGWRKIEEEPRPPNELIPLAYEAAAYWEAIDNTDVPRSMAQGLTKRAPHRAEAWAFRAITQLRDGYAEEGCASAKKAMKLDEELAAAHAAQGECYIAKFNYDEARKSFDKAIKMAEDVSEKRQYKRRRRVIR